MEHGYYWLHMEDQEPEVVEIDGDSMYRCGSDVICLFEGGIWVEYGEALDVVAITGPLVPPNAKANSAGAAFCASPGSEATES